MTQLMPLALLRVTLSRRLKRVMPLMQLMPHLSRRKRVLPLETPSRRRRRERVLPLMLRTSRTLMQTLLKQPR